MSTQPLTAEVSYVDPDTKARKRVMVKAGDTVPDGRVVLTVEPVPGGGPNVATLRRIPAQSTPVKTTAEPTPATAAAPPTTPKRKAAPKVAAPAAPPEPKEQPKEEATVRDGGEENVMKQGRVTKARKQTAAAAAKRAKAPNGRTITPAQANFTDAQATSLKKLRKSDPDKWTFKELGKHYGVSENYAYRIVKGTTAPSGNKKK